jgi:DNA-binding CsgD family transcriptional regulator
VSVLSEGHLLRLGATIVEAAYAAPDPETGQRALLDALGPVGFDVAFLETKPPRPGLVARGFDPSVLAIARDRWDEYGRELVPVASALARQGVAIDAEVLGARRERLAYYQEVVRPQRGTSSLFALLTMGGRQLGSLMLGRTGTPFGAGEAAAVRSLLAPLAVGLAATLQTSPRDEAPPSALAMTPREREVLRLLQLGYTNPEIARALGTSPNTVRNQVSSLLTKAGATTRTELVGLTVRA